MKKRSPEPPSFEISKAIVAQVMADMARSGGRARALALTPRRRTAIAKAAAKARWAKRAPKGGQ